MSLLIIGYFIISNCVINLASDKPAVFREIARVLKPGGRLAVSDIALKKELPPELGSLMELLHAEGLAVTQAPQREAESAEYGACRLGLAGRVVLFRVAKTTPTKIGQFVTLWKRPRPGAEIAPLDSDDGVDFVVVAVTDGVRSGLFVFNQAALLAHGVMSRGGQGGKRALRVYPPWSTPVAKDAIKAAQWQMPFFVVPAPGFGEGKFLHLLSRDTHRRGLAETLVRH